VKFTSFWGADLSAKAMFQVRETSSVLTLSRTSPLLRGKCGKSGIVAA
jgi:hypothetical protein